MHSRVPFRIAYILEKKIQRNGQKWRDITIVFILRQHQEKYNNNKVKAVDFLW